MSLKLSTSGASTTAVEHALPGLLDDFVASRLTAQDASLWGADAEAEARVRLGWTEAVAQSRPLLPDIQALRETFLAAGLDRVVLCGMGGSSLAPEVIAATAGVPLTVLDSTDPEQVRAAFAEKIERTVVVVSSKSGSTVETASQRRAAEHAFQRAGIDPTERIVVVTDPGSPLDREAREAGYRVFNADPKVGGRYSALTAFGLVPSGLAGADIAELLDEAEAAELPLAIDREDNPGLRLAAALAATQPLRRNILLVADGTHVIGLPDWIEQLVAESTGKDGTGLLPVVVGTDAPELAGALPDTLVVRFVHDAGDTADRNDGSDEVWLSGTLGALFLAWEVATAVVGRLLGINPFDQPDVESAKQAARSLLDAPQATPPAAFISDGIEVRGSAHVIGAAHDLDSAIEALLEELPSDGYVAVQAYLDRWRFRAAERLRDVLAARTGRPVTFGWGPRFLHSTGQFHKGGPAVGVFIQLRDGSPDDLDVPDAPYTFGQLITAQAAGDADVLIAAGRPLLALTMSNPATQLGIIMGAAE